MVTKQMMIIRLRVIYKNTGGVNAAWRFSPTTNKALFEAGMIYQDGKFARCTDLGLATLAASKDEKFDNWNGTFTL